MTELRTTPEKEAKTCRLDEKCVDVAVEKTLTTQVIDKALRISIQPYFHTETICSLCECDMYSICQRIPLNLSSCL